VLTILGAPQSSKVEETVENLNLNTGILSEDVTIGEKLRHLPAYATVMHKDKRLYIRIKRVYAIPLYARGLAWWILGSLFLWAWFAYREMVYMYVLLILINETQM
jgi:hypothetical protein